MQKLRDQVVDFAINKKQLIRLNFLIGTLTIGSETVEFKNKATVYGSPVASRDNKSYMSNQERISQGRKSQSQARSVTASIQALRTNQPRQTINGSTNVK